MRMSRHAPIWSIRVAWALLPVALAACSSPQAPRFHSLMPAATVVPAAASAAPRPTSASVVSWQLLPVTVPAQVAQPQVVVRLPDETLAVLEQDRWVAPVSDELRAAVHEQLSQRFGPPPPWSDSPAAARHRVRIDVQRFDTLPGRGALLVVDWEVRRGGDGMPGAGAGSVVACRSRLEEPSAQAGVPGAVAAQRRAVARLGQQVAAAVAGLSAGRLDCPTSS